MESFIKAFRNFTSSFLKKEEGAQIIEYALIIAVISIVLISALAAIRGDDFANLIARIGSCLSTSNCS